MAQTNVDDESAGRNGFPIFNALNRTSPFASSPFAMLIKNCQDLANSS